MVEDSPDQGIPESALELEGGTGEDFRLLKSVAGPWSAEAVKTCCRTFLTRRPPRTGLCLDMKRTGFGVEIGGWSFGTGSSWVAGSLLVAGRPGRSPARFGWFGSCDRILLLVLRRKLL